MTTIAIVGAGFSGTLLALHLLRHCPPPTKLILMSAPASSAEASLMPPAIPATSSTFPPRA